MNLAEYLRGQAARVPDSEAVVCGDERVTFTELDHTVDRLATGLRALGVRSGDRLAVCLPNGLDFVYLFLAACRLGAVTVPLNTKLTDAEIGYMLEDSAPCVVVATNERWTTLAAVASTDAIPVLVDDTQAGGGSPSGDVNGRRVERLDALLNTEPGPLPELPADADACVICYTSGTTGRPKGAVLTHANYVVAHGYLNSVSWGLGPSDRTLVTTPMAHRTGFARIVNTVCNASTVVIMPSFDVDAVLRAIETERITVLGMVPTVGRMLIDEIEQAPYRFTSLRTVLGTGETFPVELAERFEAALPNVEVFAFFAMTEVGQIAALDPGDRRDHRGSVGRPVLGLEIKLVDDLGKTVGPGETGEIAVRSGNPGEHLVMHEYYNMPEATSKAIQDGWFLTGDVGRFDAQGFLYIVDRKKDMIVSGGYNVYSREVEDAIRTHTAVAEVAVVGLPDEQFGEQVAAFIERRPEASLSEGDVTEHCSRILAGYKKPRVITFLDQLPRSPTGKLMKRELPKMLDPGPAKAQSTQ